MENLPNLEELRFLHSRQIVKNGKLYAEKEKWRLRYEDLAKLVKPLNPMWSEPEAFNIDIPMHDIRLSMLAEVIGDFDGSKNGWWVKAKTRDGRFAGVYGTGGLALYSPGRIEEVTREMASRLMWELIHPRSHR